MPQFQKLPDPWLYDTGALIGDLDCVKELILRIPVRSPQDCKSKLKRHHANWTCHLVVFQTKLPLWGKK